MNKIRPDLEAKYAKALSLIRDKKYSAYKASLEVDVWPGQLNNWIEKNHPSLIGANARSMGGRAKVAVAPDGTRIKRAYTKKAHETIVVPSVRRVIYIDAPEDTVAKILGVLRG